MVFVLVIPSLRDVKNPSNIISFNSWVQEEHRPSVHAGTRRMIPLACLTAFTKMTKVMYQKVVDASKHSSSTQKSTAIDNRHGHGQHEHGCARHSVQRHQPNCCGECASYVV